MIAAIERAARNAGGIVPASRRDIDVVPWGRRPAIGGRSRRSVPGAHDALVTTVRVIAGRNSGRPAQGGQAGLALDVFVLGLNLLNLAAGVPGQAE